MRYDVDWLIGELDAGRSFTYVGFWGDESDTPMERTFSNFHKVDFMMDGLSFSCSEQCFMYQKAMFFHDDAIAESILTSDIPAMEYKQLGRKVANFDDALWDTVKYDCMMKAVHAKYAQNVVLRDVLLGTGDAVLVEASPFDRVWGVHLGKRDRHGNVDDRWLDPRQWRGE